MTELESFKLLLHKRQVTKIEKYKNENKGCDFDLFYKQTTSIPYQINLSLLDKSEINKKANLIDYTNHLCPLQKVPGLFI